MSTQPTSTSGTAHRNTVVMASAKALAVCARCSRGSWLMAVGVRFWGTALPRRWVSRLVNTAPKSETPIEPPMVRKKVTVEVATPRSAMGASFWVASTMTCITSPMPAPSTNM